MATFSKLNGAEQQRWIERATAAQQRYGISRSAWITLCDTEHVLQTWNERECNGTIQRDEPCDRWPLGRPVAYRETRQGEMVRIGYVPDRAMGAMRRAKAVLAGMPDLMIFWQDDPRGCAVYLYSMAECLERGGKIDSCYATLGTACFY